MLQLKNYLHACLSKVFFQNQILLFILNRSIFRFLFFVVVTSSISLISSVSWAALKNITVDTSTVTSYSVEGTTYKITGGYAGATGDCSSASGSATCNSCSAITNLCTAAAICNQNSVYDALKMHITFQADSVPAGATVLVKFKGEKISLSSSDYTSGTLVANADIFVNISWQAIREKAGLTSAIGTYQETLAVGITNGTSSDTFSSSQEMTVIYRGIDSSSPMASYHTDGTSAADHACSSTEGFCSFSIIDGDSKVYVADLGIGSSDPSTYVKWKALRLFYRAGSCASAADFCNINPSTDASTQIDIKSYSSDSLSMTSNKIEGLTNETQYLFLIASQDEAGNIGNFSNPNQLQCAIHSGTPGEVVGLLKNKKCFIATAAYGSTMDSDVVLLRQFRDQILGSSKLGKSLIQFYYHHSPALAEIIATNDFYRWLSRLILWPIVSMAKVALTLQVFFESALGPVVGRALGFLVFILGLSGIIGLIGIGIYKVRNKKYPRVQLR